ncbi:MAG TPA: hypothetical protein VI194_02480 [Mycobacterium sp.]
MAHWHRVADSSVAARARVHRSFIHRHPELRAAVIAAAEDPAASGPAGTAAISRRSLLADNANLRERNRRLEQHARGLAQPPLKLPASG